MRKFTAHRICPVDQPPIPFGIVETDDDGTILSVRETGGKPVEEAGLEFHPGIIVPGFVNAHCHLELSHLGGSIPERAGMAGFVAGVNSLRAADTATIASAARRADRMMFNEGISAAGDISNQNITLDVKKLSSLRYHTFVEVFGLDPAAGASRMEHALEVESQFLQAGLPCSLSPHAPYSLSSALWERLGQSVKEGSVISIHHDESEGERLLLDSRTGPLADYLAGAGFDLGGIPQEASDILNLLDHYLPGTRRLLIHNTVTTRSKAIALAGRTWLVLCPASNLYIEDRLPDIPGLAASGAALCIGTDSLASNHRLSVLEEVKIILRSFPGIRFDTVLEWATLNGAKALGFDEFLGSIRPGKKPGLVNLTNFDWSQGSLLPETRARRLV